MKLIQNLLFQGIVLFMFSSSCLGQNPLLSKWHKQSLANSDFAVLIQTIRGDSINGQHPFISQDSTAYQLFLYSKEGQLKQEFHLDNLDPERKVFHFGWVEGINAFVLNRDEAYIYGAEMGYGSFPFIFRTKNGGMSWEPVLFLADSARLGQMEFRMIPNSLVMFNSTDGVLMQPLLNAEKRLEIKILETGDAWKSYKERKLRLNHSNHHELSQAYFKVFYDGIIELHFDNAFIKQFYQSEDKANTFDLVVVESAED